MTVPPDTALEPDACSGPMRERLEKLGVRFATRAELAQRAAAEAAPAEAEVQKESGAEREAARLLVAAAHAARREGSPARAVELCVRASHQLPEAKGLERAWSLALLAWGDPDGSRGHLQRWCDEEPDSSAALLWLLQVSWRRRPVRETGPLVERLLERLDPRGRGEGASRRVLIVQGSLPNARRLREILGHWKVESVECERNDARGADQRAGVDLALIPLPAATDGDAAAVELARTRDRLGLAGTPLLGISRLDGPLHDLHPLRELGVVGLIDRRARSEQIAFRVAQALGLRGSPQRRSVRVPVDFAVEVVAEGVATTEQAENLSCGGLRLHSSRWLEANSEVRLRFRLGSAGDEALALEGRVVHCAPPEGGSERHGLGIFFLSVPLREQQLLDAEVDRRLGESPALVQSRASASSAATR